MACAWLRHGSPPLSPPTRAAAALPARGPVYSQGAPVTLGGVREAVPTAAAARGLSAPQGLRNGAEKLERVDGRAPGSAAGRLTATRLHKPTDTAVGYRQVFTAVIGLDKIVTLTPSMAAV